MTDSRAMSGPHPTISEWTHDEETGGYMADIHGFELVVTWTPNTKDARGYFSWRATKDDEEHVSEEGFEEMELAMADAEAFAG